jgi:hypothetical protein
MRISALAILAFVASGCTIHVVEGPSTPVAQQPPTVFVTAPAPAVVAATPAPVTARPSARPADQEPSPVAQLPSTPVRTQPRAGLVPTRKPSGRVRFKDTKPEPRTTEVASAQPQVGATQRLEKVKRPGT